MMKPGISVEEVNPPEPRWPSMLAILAVGGLYLGLPSALSPGPNWVVLFVIAVLLVPTVAANRLGHSHLNHLFGIGISVVLTAALVWSVGALIVGLPEHRQQGAELLTSAGSLWVTTVIVFATWYWRLDAGGPHIRDSRGSHSEGAFLFPQMTMKPALKNWRPGFVDYLFVAFTTSTAFSPTDAPPITAWAKLMMMVQSMLSLGTIAILAGRAVNMI